MLYTRYGNNPNQVDIARKYAMLEGAETALFLSSGMAATALAHLAMLRPGDHLVSSSWIYGGTKTLFDEEFGRFGIKVTYVAPDEPRSWRQALRKNTRAIFVETPTNPLMRVLDLAPIAKIARQAGVALLVDATFASPINFRPLEHGADVVISSATKYLNGHSDVIAGAVAGSNSFIEEVTRLMKLWGPSLDPHSAWLIDRGMRTLAVRMERHNSNGLAVATWASAHPAVARVHYPGLASHPDHALATRLLGGYGGMVGLELAGGGAAAERMLRRLQVITHAPEPRRRGEPRLRAATHVAPGARPRGPLGDGHPRRIPPPQLRDRGCRRPHRRPGAGAGWLSDPLRTRLQVLPEWRAGPQGRLLRHQQG